MDGAVEESQEKNGKGNEAYRLQQTPIRGKESCQKPLPDFVAKITSTYENKTAYKPTT